ncbi:hypothetical protein CK203_093893 [Vitis vinifera]|uniref:Uncharacterized protein n=1 Tax=Vitis vinifera TaxID=29760 RepID=A0A438C7J0_VITVI|nr:hypothetical protein CK203_093893 [Vitis vinifera]
MPIKSLLVLYLPWLCAHGSPSYLPAQGIAPLYTLLLLLVTHEAIVFIRILMGCSMLNMLYHLDLSLLELVTELPNSTKGATKGYVVVSGPWAGPYELPDHPLNLIVRKMRRGRLVEWVDKASFDRLNKLYVIFSNERNHETLLTKQNLLKLVQHSESYTVPSLPRFAAKVLVPGEHYVVKDLPFYEEARAEDSKTKDDQLAQREKKCQEGTLRQALSSSRPATALLLALLPRRSPFPDLPRRP